ncbi:MAG: hypothetical protein ACI9HK_003587 [Pirellulaceae bacterium]|jgi:hypothetical protein
MMFRSTFVAFAIVGISLSSGLARAQELKPDEPGKKSTPAVSSLSDRISVNLKRTPLAEFAEFIRANTAFDCELDMPALDDVGIDPDTEVTVKLAGVSLYSVLNSVTRRLELDWRLDGKLIVVSTPEYVESRQVVRTYNCADLFYDPIEKTIDRNRLVDLIQGVVAPYSWESVGGPGAITSYRESLLISQGFHTHEDVSELLTTLSQIAKTYDKDPHAVISQIDFPNDPYSKLRRQLQDKRIRLEFTNAKLGDVVRYISSETGINFELDEKSLDEIGISPNVTVTFECKETALDQALKRMLKDLELTYVIRDEVVLISTPEEAECKLAVRIYPVRDLVIDRNSKELERALYRIVTPQSWDHNGGPGTIDRFERTTSLVIAQTDYVHDQIRVLLEQLRAAKAETSAEAKQQLNDAEQRVQVQIHYFHSAAEKPIADDVLKIVKENIPELSDDAIKEFGNSVSVLNSRVIVRAPASVHRQISNLLEQLGINTIAPEREENK